MKNIDKILVEVFGMSSDTITKLANSPENISLKNSGQTYFCDVEDYIDILKRNHKLIIAKEKLLSIK